MPLVTLIGEKLAIEGTEFIYLGPANDCKNCKLKTVCFNLKIGRKYRVEKVRDKKHTCNTHEGNATVVEVKELPIIALIDKKLSEGSITEIENQECQNIGCPNFEICQNIAIQKNKKYTVVKIIENIECFKKYNLQKAELSD